MQAQNPVVAANRQELAHFESIGRAMAEEKLVEYDDAITSAAADRVRVGFVLGDVPRSIAIDAAIELDALGQIGLARRRPVRPR